jgi:RadC-like JAB domain
MMLTDRETFVVAYLDERRNVINALVLGVGTATQVDVDIRLLFRSALLIDAAYILISHNHPNGDPTPSQADLQTTRLIEAGCVLLGVGYVDHLVLTPSGRYRSIAEFNEKGF